MRPAHADIDLAPKDAAVVQMLSGMRDLLDGVQEKYVDCASEKEHFRLKAEAPLITPPNIVAENKQGELIAIVNAMHASGIFTCTKKELMQTMGTALGCPGLSDYSRALCKIKLTNKYEDIFDNLRDAAIRERDKND